MEPAGGQGRMEGQEFDEFMLRTPTLKEVVADRMLYQCFYYHMVSRFAPENLMFRTAVLSYSEAVRSGRLDEARKHGVRIEEDFMGEQSAFEVNRKKLPAHNVAQMSDAELREDLFDDVLSLIDRDLARGLQTLWASQIFKIFVRHRKMLDAVNAGRTENIVDAGLRSIANQNAGVSDIIRQAYGHAVPLRMRRHFETGSPYSYKVTIAESDDAVGWARQTTDMFTFYDLDENELTSVQASALLGHKSQGDDNAQSMEDEDQAAPGCCQPRSRSGSQRAGGGAVSNDTSVWFVKKDSGGKMWGPIAYEDMRQMWRFHLLPEDLAVRSGKDKDFGPIKDQANFFSSSAQIHIVDPTAME